MKKTALVFGSIAGGIILVYSAIVFLALGDFKKMTPEQFQMAELFGYLRYIILLLAVFFGMRTLGRNTGYVSGYGKLVRQGILVALVVALGVGLMEAVYMMVNPGFYENFSELYMQQLKAGGANEQAIAEAKKEMEAFSWMQNPGMTGIFYFFETAIIGAIGALLIGIFIPKRKATT